MQLASRHTNSSSTVEQSQCTATSQVRERELAISSASSCSSTLALPATHKYQDVQDPAQTASDERWSKPMWQRTQTVPASASLYDNRLSSHSGYSVRLGGNQRCSTGEMVHLMTHATCRENSRTFLLTRRRLASRTKASRTDINGLPVEVSAVGNLV